MLALVRCGMLLILVANCGTAFAIEREMKESGEKGGTEDINIGIGELTECTLTGVEDIGLVSSYQFEIAYDSSVLAFDSVEDLLFGTGMLTPTFTPTGVQFSATGSAPAESVGDFFEIRFTGREIGSSDLLVMTERVFDTQAPPQEYPPAGANTLTIHVVPEPSSVLLLAVGLGGLAYVRSSQTLVARRIQ